MVYLMVGAVYTECLTLFLAKTAIDTFILVNDRAEEGEAAE